MFYQEIADKHIPNLAELYIQTYNAPPWNDQWTIPLATQKLDEMINTSNSFGLVCYGDDNNILGMIVGVCKTWYSGKEFFVDDFFVIPSRQGKGIGTLLIKELESRLNSKGVDRIYLFTSRGDKTEGYYKKRGYKSWDSLVIMGKYIPK